MPEYCNDVWGVNLISEGVAVLVEATPYWMFNHGHLEFNGQVSQDFARGITYKRDKVFMHKV